MIPLSSSSIKNQAQVIEVTSDFPIKRNFQHFDHTLRAPFPFTMARVIVDGNFL
jgi:hypothetical protein